LKSGDWKQEVAAGFRNPRELLEYLGLPELWSVELETAAADFPLRVTRYFADLMRKGDPSDPLLRQVLPDRRELLPAPGFTSDPTSDRDFRLGGGLLRKYSGRALLIATGACGINCRYCFRRHYPYSEERPALSRSSGLADAIRELPDVNEFILSGGDPLMLDNGRIAELIQPLQALPQLRRLRIHTRLPVVAPRRLDGELLSLLVATGLAVVLVLHLNHSHEVTQQLAEAVAPFRQQGITVLNQSVLLAGINDSAEELIALSESLFQIGVLPYYLHQLDRVSGAAHFAVSDSTALQLLTEIRSRLPGYLVPRLVREEAGQPAKMPL